MYGGTSLQYICIFDINADWNDVPDTIHSRRAKKWKLGHVNLVFVERA